MEKDVVDHVLTKLHDDPIGGHFGGDTTAHKIFREGYYCPTLFIDEHVYALKCQICQVNAGRERGSAFPLYPIKFKIPLNNVD